MTDFQSFLSGRNTRRESRTECPTAQQLLNYSDEKLASVRNSTGSSESTTVLPPATVTYEQLEECSMEDLSKI